MKVSLSVLAAALALSCSVVALPIAAQLDEILPRDPFGTLAAPSLSKVLTDMGSNYAGQASDLFTSGKNTLSGYGSRIYDDFSRSAPVAGAQKLTAGLKGIYRWGKTPEAGFSKVTSTKFSPEEIRKLESALRDQMAAITPAKEKWKPEERKIGKLKSLRLPSSTTESAKLTKLKSFVETPKQTWTPGKDLPVEKASPVKPVWNPEERQVIKQSSFKSPPSTASPRLTKQKSFVDETPKEPWTPGKDIPAAKTSPESKETPENHQLTKHDSTISAATPSPELTKQKSMASSDKGDGVAGEEVRGSKPWTLPKGEWDKPKTINIDPKNLQTLKDISQRTRHSTSQSLPSLSSAESAALKSLLPSAKEQDGAKEVADKKPWTLTRGNWQSRLTEIDPTNLQKLKEISFRTLHPGGSRSLPKRVGEKPELTR